MNIDEMDLLKSALDESPLSETAFQRARAQLNAHPPRKHHLRLLSRRSAVGVGALAAGAAVVFAVTSTGSSSIPATSAAQSSQSAQSGQAPVVQSPLMTLAAHITAGQAQQAGDASLVIRTQTIGNRTPETSYNLYTDAGAFFGGADERSLQQAVGANQAMDEGSSSAEVAAARSAVTGDLDQARTQLVNASPNSLGLGLGTAERQRIWDEARAQNPKAATAPQDAPTGRRLEELTGNYLWNNGLDALSAAGGDEGVRAGILRIFSTVPAIKVAEGTNTLTLTAGSDLFGGGSPETLTIDRNSGVPIRLVSAADGDLPQSVSTYQVSRVTLADLKN